MEITHLNGLYCYLEIKVVKTQFVDHIQEEVFPPPPFITKFTFY